MKVNLIDILYRHPIAIFKKYSRFGGYFNYRSMLKGSRQMEIASSKLPSVHSFSDGLPVYFLTGKKYLYQTLYCIRSLAKRGTEKYNFTLVDDGTFDQEIISQINRQLPGATIVTREMISANLMKFLPEEKFPVLHRKRAVYPHIKKLTDVHTIQAHEWKLVLDSDMLFWNIPDEIINWLKQSEQPLYMLDCQNSYGYSKTLMEQLAGQKIPDLINVGAIGLESSTINWESLEKWIAVLEEKEGTSYFLEQALSAMLIGENNATILPDHLYIVNPGNEIVGNEIGILHHYVDLSKENYFKYAWKKI